MLNEEKVILMTQAALFEEKEHKKKLRIVKYFQHDYISLQLLQGWFFGTVTFLLGLGLWGFCRMEYFLDNLHKMDLKVFGLKLLLIYVFLTAVYLCVLYGVYIFRYRSAKRSVNAHAQTLRKISNIYAHEEKNAASDTLTEDIEHDSFT